jgi:hypothetical protein
LLNHVHCYQRICLTSTAGTVDTRLQKNERRMPKCKALRIEAILSGRAVPLSIGLSSHVTQSISSLISRKFFRYCRLEWRKSH